MNQVTFRKVKDLKTHDRNPRIIKDEPFEKLCASVIDNPELFEARPIILSDRTGDLVIIAGNMRFLAAREMKLKEVPTILLSGLTEDKEKEIMISDNVNAGEWNFDTLANEFEFESLRSWGVDLSVFDLKLPEVETTVKDKNKGIQHICPNCGHEWAGSPR
jgi:ParB-like chromosome segregation protein Spo0J